jgi:hypothetical protein
VRLNYELLSCFHNRFFLVTGNGSFLIGWSRKFDEPIPLPRGRQLVTLKEAGTYITNFPKAEQEHMAAEWQAAMEALILVATLGGPTMFARIGIMQAIHRKRDDR